MTGWLRNFIDFLHFSKNLWKFLTPGGSKNTSRQIWTIEKNVRCSTKTDVFSNVQIWWPVFLEPFGVKRRNVPHFKGLIYAKVELEAQGHDSTFTICHAPLKKAILHYKRALASFVLSSTVHSVIHQKFLKNGMNQADQKGLKR